MLAWIKLTTDLPEKWQTQTIRRTLGARSVDEVVGKLFRLWRHFENQSDAGRIPRVTAADLDELVGKRGFAAAVAAVGWLTLHDGGGAELPNFDRHMGAASRKREADAERAKRYRGRDEDEPAADADRDAGVTPTVTKGGRGRDADRDAGVTAADPKKEKEKEKEITTPAESLGDGGGAGKSRKPADTPHHQAVAAFCDAWAARYGERYPFDGGKDGATVKALLAQVGGDVEKFRAAVGRYFAAEDAFATDGGHTLGIFRAQFAKHLAGRPPGGRVGQPHRVEPRPGKYARPDGPVWSAGAAEPPQDAAPAGAAGPPAGDGGGGPAAARDPPGAGPG